MLKKTVKYTDFDGNDRSEDFYFNLTKGELLELQFGQDGGLDKLIEKIIATNDMKRVFALFKELITKAYGEKSLDGKRFVKSEEISIAFTQTQAYSDLIMELATNASIAADFVNGIMPSDLRTDSDQPVLPSA